MSSDLRTSKEEIVIMTVSVFCDCAECKKRPAAERNQIRLGGYESREEADTEAGKLRERYLSTYWVNRLTRARYRRRQVGDITVEEQPEVELWIIHIHLQALDADHRHIERMIYPYDFPNVYAPYKNHQWWYGAEIICEDGRQPRVCKDEVC